MTCGVHRYGTITQIDWLCFTSHYNVFKILITTLQVVLGTGFYGSNDPTSSVKALKEVSFFLVVLRNKL